MAERKQITQKGYEDTKARLDQLINVEKPNVLAALAAARAQGDLSENADYDAARERRDSIEREIDQLQYIIDHAIIVENNEENNDSVKVGGAPVTVKNLETGTVYTFRIVGSSEAKPISLISNESPIAKAILNHRVGDVVLVEVEHPYELEITKIGE